jgi:uncharacterized protein (DUF427 family)
MSLTAGSGPFGKRPNGRFNFTPEPPTGSALFWEPVPYRLRAVVAGETVVDSRGAHLLHETGHLPVYYVPFEALRGDLLERTETRTHCPHKGDASYWTIRAPRRTAPDAVWAYEEPLEPASFLRGYAALYWHVPDDWFAEEERLSGHPRDPYHRVDVYRTSRRVRAVVGGETIAESVRAKALFETGHPTRYYFPPEDVRVELLEPSPKSTRCAYKGAASYWHVRTGGELHENVAWTYAAPLHDGEPIRDLIAFHEDCVQAA